MRNFCLWQNFTYPLVVDIFHSQVKHKNVKRFFGSFMEIHAQFIQNVIIIIIIIAHAKLRLIPCKN